MKKFVTEQYEKLATDLLGDIFYSDSSYRGKISQIRQYAEIIVRRLVDYDPNKSMTLGNDEIKKRLISLPDYMRIKQSVERIRIDGNRNTHTQYRGDVNKNDYEQAVDSLFDLLAFLYVDYFDRYEFGKRREVIFAFSLLPPIIRYKTLNCLYEKNPENPWVIEKLCLAILKAFSGEEARNWIEEHKGRLSKIKLESELVLKASSDKKFVLTNFYDYCLWKNSQLLQFESGVVYSDFESALRYYQKYGVLEGNEREILEFNDLMKFVYMGRKEKVKEIQEETAPFVVTAWLISLDNNIKNEIET